MRDSDLAGFEQALRAKEAAITRSLRNRDGLAVDRTADSADEAQRALDRELMAEALHRETVALANVKLALQRIQDGTYGVCQRCEEDISPKRLNAVPWAHYCIACQEVIDTERRREIDLQPDRAMAA